MARRRRDVHPADLPGFSQTLLTRRTMIAGAGAAITAVGGARCSVRWAPQPPRT
jgi:hypothetical protein